MEILKEVLGWTSVILYISITIFNSMRVTRYTAFGSAANDIVWAVLMGWWPKVILNLSVAAVNTYRYVKDFTATGKYILNFLALVVLVAILYIVYVAVSGFMAEPTLPVALQFADLAIIVCALFMTIIKNFRVLMLLSGVVGMFAYMGNMQMMIIKSLVIGIMLYKLLVRRDESKVV